MSLDMEVDFGPGDIMLDGDLAPPWKWAQKPPQFSADVYTTCCKQVVPCIQTSNRLSLVQPVVNRIDNRLYRVNGVL